MIAGKIDAINKRYRGKIINVININAYNRYYKITRFFGQATPKKPNCLVVCVKRIEDGPANIEWHALKRELKTYYNAGPLIMNIIYS